MEGFHRGRTRDFAATAAGYLWLAMRTHGSAGSPAFSSRSFVAPTLNPFALPALPTCLPVLPAQQRSGHWERAPREIQHPSKFTARRAALRWPPAGLGSLASCVAESPPAVSYSLRGTTPRAIISVTACLFWSRFPTFCLPAHAQVIPHTSNSRPVPNLRYVAGGRRAGGFGEDKTRTLP